MADERVLIVDDDINILDSFERRFAKKLDVHTAPGPKEGLAALSQKGPFAVVVSDYRMPVMNGVDFLAQVKQASPDTVRILLTGFADLKTAIDAVNQGSIFRLLTKPCPSAVIIQALAEGIKQYRLVYAERDLLQNTLRGSVQILTELLALSKPDAFGRASRLESLTRKMALVMDVSPMWEIELAAALSQIGLFAFPDALIRKIVLGRKLTPEEQVLFANHPQTAADLIANIPRLERVARIVAYQEKGFDGSGVPEDSIQGKDIITGARVLKLAIDFDAFTQSGLSMGEALNRLKRDQAKYDPAALSALAVVLADESKFAVRELSVVELKEQMILADDIYSTNPSRKLLAKGHELTPSILNYIKQLRRTIGVREPIHVVEPLSL